MTTKKIFVVLLAFVLCFSSANVFAEVGIASQKLDGYAYSESSLVLGEDSYVLDAEYAYTVFYFEPTEVGKYYFTVANGLIAVVSYNGMWVTIEPTPETVTEAIATWECNSVGQSIYLAVISGDSSASISIEKEEVVIVEIPWTIYENQTTPQPFVFEGDMDELLYVDTFDDVVDTAVLGRDGYYHLGSANGPILYAHLNDSFMSISAAMSYGQVRYAIMEGDEIVAKIDCNDALAEYVDCADSSLYPLTLDLIIMFQNVGEYRDWYGEDGWVGGKLEDAWMFACYYLEAEEPTYSPYDIDYNGVVEQADLDLLMAILVGNEESEILVDFDLDGVLTIYDCVLLAQQIA